MKNLSLIILVAITGVVIVLVFARPSDINRLANLDVQVDLARERNKLDATTIGEDMGQLVQGKRNKWRSRTIGCADGRTPNQVIAAWLRKAANATDTFGPIETAELVYALGLLLVLVANDEITLKEEKRFLTLMKMCRWIDNSIVLRATRDKTHDRYSVDIPSDPDSLVSQFVKEVVDISHEIRWAEVPQGCSLGG